MDASHLKLLMYFAYGAVGGLIGSMAKSRRLTLPRMVGERLADGTVRKIIDPGFVTAPLLGGLLAAYFDVRPENSIAWGLAAGYAGPSILNALVDQLLKRLGLAMESPLNPSLPDVPADPPTGGAS